MFLTFTKVRHDSLKRTLRVEDNLLSYPSSSPFILNILQTATFLPSIPSEFPPFGVLTFPSLIPFNLDKTRSETRSLYFPRDQSLSLPHWAVSQVHLVDAYITFPWTICSLGIQIRGLEHHLATTLGSIAALRNSVLPEVKTFTMKMSSIRRKSDHAAYFFFYRDCIFLNEKIQ